MEWGDVYDEKRRRTGRVHLRGTPWNAGEYGLVVCVWVYDGLGNFLLTRRAPEKSYAGTWENSGGMAQAGEDSRTAVARELFEETGICAEPQAFEFLGSGRDSCTFYDFYALKYPFSIDKIKLLPEETDGVMRADYEKIHRMITSGDGTGASAGNPVERRRIRACGLRMGV